MIPHPTMAWTRRRLRLLSALQWAGRALLMVAPLSVLAAALARAGGAELPAWWPLGAPAIAGIAGAVAWLARKPSDLEAAIALDRRLGLDERISTAAASWPLPLPADVDAVLHRSALERLSACDRGRLVAAFPLPRPARALAVLAALAIAAWCVPLIPGPESGKSGTAADAARQRREAQQVREAARRLEKRAEDAARVLTRPGTENARSFARKAAAEARDLAARAHGRAPALARLSKLSDALAKAQRADLQSPAGDAKPFGQSDPAEELAKVAEAAAGLDLPGLDKDLGRLTTTLAAEAKAAREAGRGASVDHKKLEDLERRLAAAQELARRIAELLEKNPELRKKLEEALKRLNAKLAKAREDVKRLGGA